MPPTVLACNGRRLRMSFLLGQKGQVNRKCPSRIKVWAFVGHVPRGRLASSARKRSTVLKPKWPNCPILGRNNANLRSLSAFLLFSHQATTAAYNVCLLKAALFDNDLELATPDVRTKGLAAAVAASGLIYETAIAADLCMREENQESNYRST